MPAASPRQTRAPKKSETLEVRIPFETKTAFMARCQDDGRTASDAVRGFIERELAPARRTRTRGWQARPWQALAAAIAGLAIGALAAPSLAQTANGHAAFQTLDRNHDGVLSPAEFAAR